MDRELTELEAYKLLIKDSFELQLNMNDTFYYATADVENMQAHDVKHILPLIQKYGHDAINAYVAVIRGHDPQISKRITEGYLKSKETIKAMADKGTILWERWAENKERSQEEKAFGKPIEWSCLKRFLHMVNKPGENYVVRMARVDDIVALGKSEHDTKTRLCRKWDRIKKLRQKSNV